MSKKERKALEDKFVEAAILVMKQAKIHPGDSITKSIKKDCKSWSKKLMKASISKTKAKPKVKKSITAKKPVSKQKPGKK